MKKTLTLVALLSVTTFSAMADELKTMTQEQAKVETQTKLQTQNQVRTHVQENQAGWQSSIPDENAYNKGTESEKLSQPKNQMRHEVKTQTQTKTQSQMQNRIQTMQPQMGNRMQTHTGGSGRGH